MKNQKVLAIFTLVAFFTGLAYADAMRQTSYKQADKAPARSPQLRQMPSCTPTPTPRPAE